MMTMTYDKKREKLDARRKFFEKFYDSDGPNRPWDMSLISYTQKESGPLSGAATVFEKKSGSTGDVR